MNISRINLVVGALLTAYASQSYADTATQQHSVIPGKQKIQREIGDKQRTDGLYFVQLKDSALAGYDGSLKGLSATSINASDRRNITPKGMLDVTSRSSVSYQQYLKSKQVQVTQRLSNKLNRALKPAHSYQVLINALAVHLEPDEVNTIAQDPDVLSVEPVGMHYLNTSSGPEFIGAKQIWQGSNGNVGTKGEGVIVGIIDTGINASHRSFADVGGDGYDHTNPLQPGNYLGDCQAFPKFCNDKLIGIVSYPEITNNRPAVKDDSYEDLEDKMKVGYDFHGHGSHVGSTAAGNILNNVNYYLSVEDDDGKIDSKSAFNFEAISGVAPHANIVSYQVCDEGGCYPELTVLALEHAIANGVNVINYSVGGSARDPWSSADALAFLNAREAGLHVATSAGNSGPEAKTVGSPGNAPWLTTVAAYTHDRSFTDKLLTGFSGGDTTPTDMTGKAATAGMTGKVVLAKDFGDAQCLVPFAENTFNGEIVVCERGAIARVRKGLNVQLGGAGGLIFINLPGEASSLDSDNHVIPAIHLSADDGVSLVNWLSSGVEHQVTITASTLTKDPSLGDIARAFSSRGPNLPYPNIFAPDIAAPGVDVYAAYAEDKPFDDEVGHIPFTTMSGTSMASPHVAGALALIKAAHPDWTPAQAQSAIMSTAHQLTYKDDDYDGVKDRSDFFDQGAGSLRVNAAVNAGLILDVTKAEYLAADPFEGGDPSALNTTSMVQTNCISNCTWTRVVTATKSSSWTASYEYLQPGFTLQVSPATFSLNAGQSQTLTITAKANIELVDEWVHGYVNLKNADTSMSDTHLQATIGFKAGKMIENVSASLNNLNNKVTIADVTTSGSNDLQANGFGLFKAKTLTGTAEGSSNAAERNSPESFHNVIFPITASVKPYTKRLIAEIVSSTSPDMDLYVGIDENNDGLPDALEMDYSLVCVSGNEDSNEQCVIETPVSGNYWIFAHNYKGTEDGKPDDVSIRLTQITYTSAPSFDIDAPTSVAQDEKFDITLNVNGYLSDNNSVMPLEEGEVYYGLFELGTTAAMKRNVGSTLVKINGLAPVDVPVNRAPEVTLPIADRELQLGSDGKVSLSLNLEGVFTDPDGDVLTLSAEGMTGLTITNQVLAANFTSAGNYLITVSATDGEYVVSTDVNVTVLAQPVIVTPPTPEKSSGGALGYALFIFLGLLCVNRSSR